MDNISKVRESTLQDFEEKLRSKNRCVLIRPTGFGKTWLLTHIIRSYNSVLYVYPADVIKNTVINRYYDEDDALDPETKETMRELSQVPNTTLMTYAKLALSSKEELSNLPYDIIIFDECHRLGGPKTRYAVDTILANNKNITIAGATATPMRSDGFDVISTYFANITVFPYTLHDAFQDGLLKKPYYCYCTYDIETDLKESALMAGEDLDNLIVKEVLKKGLIEISNIHNMESIIRDVTSAHLSSTKYMKFISFFTSIAQLDDKLPQVKNWLHQSYPEHNIRSLEISSRNSATKNNVTKLDDLEPQDNVIDLISCVEMINMGYHVDNLSGIIMYRGTSSDIIYIQQLGRALSSGASESCVVFDIVDNLHRKAVFDLNVARPKKEEKLYKLGYKLDSQGKVVNTEGTEGPYSYHDNAVYDVLGNLTDIIIDRDGQLVMTHKPKWYHDATLIKKEDLYAVGHEATYRELIAKVVAEPMSIRCREAIEAHFKRWCDAHNIEYPISKDKLVELYGLDPDEFTRQFAAIVNSNNIDYPLNDVNKLMEIGKSEAGVPLSIFAKWKNVSIPAILELMGVV